MVRLRKKYYGDSNLSKSKRPYKYQLDYYNNGKRVRDVIKDIIVNPSDSRDEKKEKERIAQRYRSKMEIELGNRKVGLTSRQLQKANFIEYFEVQMNKKNESTKVAWENTYKHLIKYQGKKLKFEDVTVSWIEGFKEYLLEQVSNNSVLTYLIKINTALNQAVKEKIIFENPYKYIDKVKKEEKEMVFLLKDEIQELINTSFFDNEVKNAFLFSCYTGLRVSDIQNLNWSKIKDDKLYLTQQKTKAVVYIPLNENAKSILKYQKHNKTKVFKLSSHISSINRTLRKFIKITSIDKDVTFHSARHTFATLLITSGVNIFTVSKLLGHTDIESTLVYAKVIDEEKDKAVNSMPNFKL